VFEGHGKINEYVGGYSDWLRQRTVPATAAAPAPGTPAPGTPAPAAQASAPKARRLSYKDQRELAALPEKIQVLEGEQLGLQAQIADPALFKSDPMRAAAALQRLQALTEELERAYSRWDELES
jgi:ABC transport system ATP-binding/permease protein